MSPAAADGSGGTDHPGPAPAGAAGPGGGDPGETALAEARATEYPRADDGIFLNAAGYGLLPLRSARAASDLTLRRNRPGGVREEELGATFSRCRSAVARLLDVEPEEITLAPNTSFGVNLGATLAAAGEKGTVLLSEGEFPANVYPWLALRDHGFGVEVIPADPAGLPRVDRMMERIGEGGVRVLALSAVQFASGYRADLAAFGRLCREHDVLFVVDAIQALGAVPLHPADTGIDVLASGGQKWLCSPWGSGFAWIHPRHRSSFDPPMVSWLAMEAARDFTDVLGYRWGFLDDGRKFELASLGVQDYLGLAHTVELFLEVGVETIRRHLIRVQRPLLDWIEGRDDTTLVTPRDLERRAGIVSFTVPEPERVVAGLVEAGVAVVVREGAVRVSPHLYNTVAQMEEVVEMLEEATGR